MSLRDKVTAAFSRLRSVVKHKGGTDVDARGHVVVVVALESRGSPLELLDELENCSHPRSGNGRRYKSAALPPPAPQRSNLKIEFPFLL